MDSEDLLCKIVWGVLIGLLQLKLFSPTIPTMFLIVDINSLTSVIMTLGGVT